MGKKDDSKVSVVDLFKQALESLGAGLLQVCNELDSIREENVDLRRRLSVCESELVVLAGRLDAADLRAGVAKTGKVAKLSFMGVSQIEEFGGKDSVSREVDVGA